MTAILALPFSLPSFCKSQAAEELFGLRYSAGLFFTALGLSFHTGIYFLQGLAGSAGESLLPSSTGGVLLVALFVLVQLSCLFMSSR